MNIFRSINLLGFLVSPNMLKMRFLLFPQFYLFSLAFLMQQIYFAITSAAENTEEQVLEWQRDFYNVPHPKHMLLAVINNRLSKSVV